MRRTIWIIRFHTLLLAGIVGILLQSGCKTFAESQRERISIDNDWRFTRKDPATETAGDAETVSDESLDYPVNPTRGRRSGRRADSRPAVDTTSGIAAFILPTGNDFIADPAKRYVRPEGNYGADVSYVSPTFDDADWQELDLPHDFAIEGPFSKSGGGGMGRLPSAGVVWYRKHIAIDASDVGKQIYLDIDGSMSYTTVWCNGQIVGGWPYGYSSWRVDLTPYVEFGKDNVLAIRLDNPPNSSRWYPGGGIYRNVWLVKTAPVHIGHWGTFVTTRDVSVSSATIDLEVTIDNNSESNATVDVTTRIYALDADGSKTGDAVAGFESLKTPVAAGESVKVKDSVTLENPRLWGPPPTQTPRLYVAVTTLMQDGKPIDQYETTFGIRDVRFDPNTGIHVNGERIFLRGVNMHHDLGALGAAFNYRAAQRQLEMLREMGCNAIRTSHNPPAPELLELTDKLGFLVMDEAFDVWVRQKTPFDYHLIFPDWHEQDLRALVRRDRNHPSVIMWSFGNEVGEQYTGEEGAALAKRLKDIINEEDPTRPTTTAMNYAKPDMPLPEVPDVISLNYQGEGIRQSPEFEGTNRIRTPPQYSAFHEEFPDKVVLSSETACAFSSRGIYLFPVVQKISDIVRDGRGGDYEIRQVSAYELHAVDFGSSADKVFGSIDGHPYVAGEFVWTGWDYLGEPTPYDSSRSSYCGIIDLAGFGKARFYLYQSHWRPDLPMAHILPHWTWPERIGQVTPVHVFTSGDEAELFLNGKSLGKKTKGRYEYRLRWDDVTYEPGELKVITYKDGKQWATDTVSTAGDASQMSLRPDRAVIKADGLDLSFITLTIQDSNGITVPRANNLISFSVSGPGEIVATDNGDPTDFTIFSSPDRKVFNGLALVIIKAKRNQSGPVVITAECDGLPAATCTVLTR
jgi:beta-galactosidase